MVSSPCINVCKMDPQSGLCQGCLRTLDEIAAWGRADDTARLRILTAVAGRRQQQAPQGGQHSDCER